MAGRAGHPLRAGRGLTADADQHGGAAIAGVQEAGDEEARRVGAMLMARLEALSGFTDVPGELTRLYLTPAHKAAALQVAVWMREAGLEAWIDDVGNVVGRTAPPGDRDRPAGAWPVLILGSHIDTVRQAGRYDGAFGVLAAVAALGELRAAGKAMPCAVEVVAFGDEEGVRFPVTMAGSRSLAGRFDPASLDTVDADGVSLREALVRFGCDPAGITGLSRIGCGVAGYVEAHIEQGPVLEAQSLPLGVVTAIAGATRLRIAVAGTAGHAGTVPMSMRHDALVAAAAMVLAVEQVAQQGGRSLVATVGQMLVSPGAPNSIPGDVEFSVDVRAAEDSVRHDGVAAIRRALGIVAAERGVRLHCAVVHEAAAVACAASLQDSLERAVGSLGVPPLRLASGAGHDAMAMAALCPVGMLFTRCWRGVSHNPAEAISVADAGLTVLALCAWLRAWRPDA